MTRPALRHAALPATLLLLSLGSLSAVHAQNAYLGSNTTIDAAHSVAGYAAIGYGSNADYSTQTNPVSPTVDLVSGGSIGLEAYVFNSSTFNISGGSVGGSGIRAFNSSTVNISDGSALSIDVDNSSTLNLSGGNIGAVNAYDNSIVNLSGGTINQTAFAIGSSTLTVSGGSIGSNFLAGGNSVLNFFGGNFGGDFYATENSTLNFFGTGLSDTLTDPNASGSYSQYALFGTLSNGTRVNGKYVYLANGSNAQAIFHNTAVPEASSVISFGILGLGSAGLLARRRKKGRSL